MTTTVDVYEAKTRLSELLERVMNGEQIVIARAGKPVAMLVPVAEVPERRVPGIDAGKAVIEPDFDEPLPEFEL